MPGELNQEKLSNCLIEAVIKFCQDNILFKHQLKVTGHVVLDVDNQSWCTNINELFSSSGDTIQLPEFSMDPMESLKADNAKHNESLSNSLENVNDNLSTDQETKFPDIESIRNLPDLFPRSMTVGNLERDPSYGGRHRHSSDGMANITYRSDGYNPYSVLAEPDLAENLNRKKKRWKSGFPDTDHFTRECDEKGKSVFEILGLDSFFSNQNDQEVGFSGGRTKTISLSSDKMSLSDIKEFLLTPKLEKQSMVACSSQEAKGTKIKPSLTRPDNDDRAGREVFAAQRPSENEKFTETGSNFGMSESQSCAGIVEDISQMLQELSDDVDVDVVDDDNGDVVDNLPKQQQREQIPTFDALNPVLNSQPIFSEMNQHLNKSSEFILLHDKDNMIGIAAPSGYVNSTIFSQTFSSDVTTPMFHIPLTTKSYIDTLANSNQIKLPVCKPLKKRTYPTVAELLLQRKEGILVSPKECVISSTRSKIPEVAYCSLCKQHYIKPKNVENVHYCKEIICPECDQRFTNVAFYVKHISQDHLLCFVCGMKFLNIEAYDVHRNMQHKDLVCDICGLLLRSILHLKDHLKIHETPVVKLAAVKKREPQMDKNHPKFQTVCKGNYSRDKANGQLHICSECGKVFQNKSYLKKHLPTHDENRKYVCKICGKGFKSQSNMKSHMRVHSNVKPYVCQLCNKAFRQLEALITHKKRHGKSFTCKLCSKTLANVVVLQEHLRTTHSGLEFKCPKCDMYFKHKRAINRHLQIKHNDGEKSWSCCICHKKFPTKDYLNYHMKTKHGSEASSLELLSLVAGMVKKT